MKEDVLYIVVPCYNDEDVVEITAARLCEKLTELINGQKISPLSRVCLLDDGSADETWSRIEILYRESSLITGVKPAYNCGEQRAYLTGMSYAVGYADVIVTADSDLQDDIQAIDEMLRQYEQGFEIVYGVRCSRRSDTLLKKGASHIFYTVMKAAGTKLIAEHSQYRLMSKKAVQALLEYREDAIFLPARIPTLGFRSTNVYYDRLERAAGVSHYNFAMLIRMGVDAAVFYGKRTCLLLWILSLIALLSAVFCVISALFTAAAVCLTGTVLLITTAATATAVQGRYEKSAKPQQPQGKESYEYDIG